MHQLIESICILLNLSFCATFLQQVKGGLKDMADDYQLQSGVAAGIMSTGNMVIARTVTLNIAESLSDRIESCPSFEDKLFVHYRTLMIIAGLLNIPMVLLTASDYGELLLPGLGLVMFYCFYLRFVMHPCWLLDALVLAEMIPKAILVLSAIAFHKKHIASSASAD